MIFLELEDVLRLHQGILARHGGASGIRDLGALESAIAQPRMTFAGVELYSTVADKAAAICYSLVRNHAFVDGNKRIGYVALETFLVLNNHELAATVDDAEQTMLQLAAGELTREELVEWIQRNLKPLAAGA